ncbi:MAG: GTPase Era [Candidatus Omnitrophica bacterium]|nr:GTPase Era [Candidatus Omnitrophota bacterium]
MNDAFRSGFVAVIGKPNVGKSTLLNSILNQKVAIVSSKPETTRENIKGILTTDSGQAVFIDTPGIHKPHLLLGKLMVKKAKTSLFDGDLLVYMVELTSGLTDADYIILDLIKEAKKPAIAVINKIDIASKSKALPIIEELKDQYEFLEYIPISALNNDGVGLLRDKIFFNLPEGEKYYPDSFVTDKTDQFQVAEIIREKALMLTREEVPHSVAVQVERMDLRQDKDILDIEATIYVERESQKGIIVGQKGSMAKEIGSLSRQELEEKFGKKVFLRIWVKVLKNWRKDPKSLKRLSEEGS